MSLLEVAKATHGWLLLLLAEVALVEGLLRLSELILGLEALRLLAELRQLVCLATKLHGRGLRLLLLLLVRLLLQAEHWIRLKGWLLRLLLLLHGEWVHRLLGGHAHVRHHRLEARNLLHAWCLRLLALSRDLNVVQRSVLVVGRVRVRLVHLVQVLDVDGLLGHVSTSACGVAHIDVGWLLLRRLV